MIDLHVIQETAFVWNVEDAVNLREKHRIVGKCVGCLPRTSYQNNFLGLPLQLMKEEAQLLAELGLGQLVTYLECGRKPTENEKLEFIKHRHDSYKEQCRLYKESRRRVILEKADRIVEGRCKKLLKLKSHVGECAESLHCEDPQVEQSKVLNSSSHIKCNHHAQVVLDREHIIKEELKKVDALEMSPATMLVQIPLERHSFKSSETIPAKWDFPSSDKERLRFCTFKDLWLKGFFITSGSKFGGDFLIYPGDPLRYHALYVAVCMLSSQCFTGLDIIAIGRLGSIVKKAILICSYDKSENMNYTTLEWAGMS